MDSEITSYETHRPATDAGRKAMPKLFKARPDRSGGPQQVRSRFPPAWKGGIAAPAKIRATTLAPIDITCFEGVLFRVSFRP